MKKEELKIKRKIIRLQKLTKSDVIFKKNNFIVKCQERN